MEGIIANATVLRLEMQVTLHDALEKFFPAFILRRINKATDSYQCDLMKPPGYYRKVCYHNFYITEEQS